MTFALSCSHTWSRRSSVLDVGFCRSEEVTFADHTRCDEMGPDPPGGRCALPNCQPPVGRLSVSVTPKQGGPLVAMAACGGRGSELVSPGLQTQARVLLEPCGRRRPHVSATAWLSTTRWLWLASHSAPSWGARPSRGPARLWAGRPDARLATETTLGSANLSRDAIAITSAYHAEVQGAFGPRPRAKETSGPGLRADRVAVDRQPRLPPARGLSLAA